MNIVCNSNNNNNNNTDNTEHLIDNVYRIRSP